MKQEYQQKEIIELLIKAEAFSEANKSTIDILAETAEVKTLKQGQTLIRSGKIESHAFLLIDGTLRLLSENPFSGQPFTVGRAKAGEVIGLISLLRQGGPMYYHTSQNARIHPNQIQRSGSRTNLLIKKVNPMSCSVQMLAGRRNL